MVFEGLMSETAELHGKILSFLAGEFARKEGRQCVAVEIVFAPGNGFKEEPIRKWVREDDPDLFDNFANVEKLVGQIIEIATGEADAKSPGKYHFKVRTHQHLGERPYMSFPLSPSYNGSEDTALTMAGAGGGGRGETGVIANHAGQLMRINAQMFDGTIRVLGQQSSNLHEQVQTLTRENAILRHELEEARSNKMEREFQVAMAAEKNMRTNAGFQKLLQIGTIMAAKIGGSDEKQGGGQTSLAMLLGEFQKSLRPDQIGVLMSTLDMAQKIMFMEIMNLVAPPEQPPNGAAPSLGPSGGQASP